MNKVMKCAAVCMIASFLVAVGRPQNVHASDETQEVCYPVVGKIDVLFTTGCGSPYDLCTAGTSQDYFGLLNGTTSYSAQGLGGSPVGEASILVPASEEPDTTWSFGGDLVITTPFGDLVLRDVGVFDTAIGALAEIARVETGTGIFTGAHGHVFITGNATEGGEGFASKYRGKICWDLPAHD